MKILIRIFAIATHRRRGRGRWIRERRIDLRTVMYP
jgi:hypothetical protein